MKYSKRKYFQNISLIFVLSSLTSFTYAALNIDNFNGTCGVCLDNHVSPSDSIAKDPNYGYVLGIEADLTVVADSDNQQELNALLDVYVLDFMGFVTKTDVDNAATSGVSDGGYFNIVYDGDDGGSETNGFGLAHIDLTESGAANNFYLFLSTSTAADTLDLYVYTDANYYSQIINLPIPFNSNFFTQMDVLFSQFADGGVSGGADFSDVTAIEVQLNHNKTTNGVPIIPIPIVNITFPFTGNHSVTGYGLAIDHFGTSTQLETSIEASLANDINEDGDFDSASVANGGGDTVLYTVKLTNKKDMQALDASGVIYSADFVQANATFVDNSVDIMNDFGGDSAVVIDQTGNVIVNVGTIPDRGTVTITYQVKIDSDLQGVPDIAYSHFGSVVANEWPSYNLDTNIIKINQFDIQANMTVAALDDADGDSYSGEGERVRFSVSLSNIGVNTSNLVVFDLPEIENATLVATSVSPSTGVSVGNTPGDKTIQVRFSNFAPAASANFTFEMTINEPFFFSMFDSISAQAVISNDAGPDQPLFISSTDDPNNLTSFQDPTSILVDAFPNRIDAHADGDGDGFPENCNPACDDEDEYPNDTNNDGATNDAENDNADDDGDSVPNGYDAFPFHCEASLDSDGDGMPDSFIFPTPVGCSVQSAEDSQLTEDLDDDNDLILDENDDFPTNKAADTDTDGDGKPDVWLASCDASCQSESGLTLDNDDDNDLVLDVNDAFPLNNAASVDGDSDGFPDAWNTSCNVTCQTNSGLTLDPFINDSDNDGVINSADAFPNNNAAAIDTDGDGKPDAWFASCDDTCQTNSGLILDDDDDGDGVLDDVDDFPLHIAASVDADHDGLPDKWNDGTGGTVNCDPACQTNSGLTLDSFLNDTDNDGVTNDPENDTADDDGDGIPNGEDDDDFADNKPPVVTAPSNRTVTASGKKTTVVLGHATATDIVQGIVVNINQSSITASDTGPFTVGVHTITWTAIDAAGNIGTAKQKVTVNADPNATDDDGDKKSSGGGGGSLGFISLLILMLFSLRRKLALY